MSGIEIIIGTAHSMGALCYNALIRRSLARAPARFESRARLLFGAVSQGFFKRPLTGAVQQTPAGSSQALSSSSFISFRSIRPPIFVSHMSNPA